MKDSKKVIGHEPLYSKIYRWALLFIVLIAIGFICVLSYIVVSSTISFIK